MFRTARVIVPWIALAVSLPGQSTLSGPSLGFVFDSDAKGIRPILGIPGAASLGKPLDLGIAVVKAAISPQEDYMLAFSSDSSLLLVRSNNGVISKDTNANIAGVPDLIAISPSGQSAVLFYRQMANVQVLTGLPKSLAAPQTIDISGLPNSLDTLAVTDDGQFVLATELQAQFLGVGFHAGARPARHGNDGSSGPGPRRREILLICHSLKYLTWAYSLTNAGQRPLVPASSPASERPFSAMKLGTLVH